MNILNTKIFREIRINKGRSITIISVVAITFALLAGMRASGPMLYDSLDQNHIEKNVADGRMQFIQPILQSNITSIRNDNTFLDNSNIDRIEGRLVIRSEIIYKEEKFPAVIIGINYPNSVNELHVTGISNQIDSIENIFNDNSSCMIEARFAGGLLGQDIQLGEKISIPFDNSATLNFSMNAIVQDSDILYVIDPNSGMSLMGQMAVIWVDLTTLQNIAFGGIPVINEILFTVDISMEKSMINKAADDLMVRYASNNIDITSTTFIIFDETEEIKFFEADAGSMDKIGTIFGIIGILICSVMIFNTLNRMVQSQNKNIGLFLAMGAEKKKIVIHYLKITMILAVIGVIIGIPLGYGMARAMAWMILKLFVFETYSNSFAYIEFLYAAIIILLVCLLFSTISAYPITKVTPRSAMSAVFHRIKVTGRSIAEKLFGWIPIFDKVHMNIPLREIFLRKKRTVFTILANATSMIILIISVAMILSMYSQILNNYDEYNTEDVRIVFEDEIPISNITNYITNELSTEITYHEVYLELPTKINHDGQLLTRTSLQCYQSNSTLRNFNLIEGDIIEKSDMDKNGIILGQAILGKYNLSLNDEIQIGILGNYTVSIDGIVAEFIDYSVLWTLESFYEANISSLFDIDPGYVNGLLIEVSEDTDMNLLRANIEGEFNVSSWAESEKSRAAVMNFLRLMMEMLILFIAVGMLIGVMFSFSTMYVAFMDREDDFLALKAMGAKNSVIRNIIFWETTLLSVLSLIITLPIGTIIYRVSIDYLLQDNFYISRSIPWVTWIFVFILSTISIWLATWKLTRKVKKMVLADELRSRNIS